MANGVKKINKTIYKKQGDGFICANASVPHQNQVTLRLAKRVKYVVGTADLKWLSILTYGHTYNQALSIFVLYTQIENKNYEFYLPELTIGTKNKYGEWFEKDQQNHL